MLEGNTHLHTHTGTPEKIKTLLIETNGFLPRPMRCDRLASNTPLPPTGARMKQQHRPPADRVSYDPLTEPSETPSTSDYELPTSLDFSTSSFSPFSSPSTTLERASSFTLKWFGCILQTKVFGGFRSEGAFLLRFQVFQAFLGEPLTNHLAIMNFL